MLFSQVFRHNYIIFFLTNIYLPFPVYKQLGLWELSLESTPAEFYQLDVNKMNGVLIPHFGGRGEVRVTSSGILGALMIVSKNQTQKKSER